MRIFLGNTAGKSAKEIKSPSVFGVRIRNLIIQFMSSFMNITLISFMIVLKERTTKKFSSEKVGWFFFSSYVLLLCRRIVAVLIVNHAEPRLQNALVDLDHFAKYRAQKCNLRKFSSRELKLARRECSLGWLKMIANEKKRLLGPNGGPAGPETSKKGHFCPNSYT